MTTVQKESGSTHDSGEPRHTSAGSHKLALKKADAERASGSLEKSLDVLEMVMSTTYPPSAAQITDALTLPRPTTNRIISNLVKLNFLKRDVRYRELAAGDRLLKLALNVIASATQRGPAHEILRELSSVMRETCNIGTIAAGRIRYVDRVEAHWPLALRLEPGSDVPLHCTAIGKLLLASLPEQQREKYIDILTLTAHTEHTVTSRSVLRERLTLIAEQGYSLDNQEHLPGVLGIAVPIPSGEGYPVLALGMAVPTARATTESLKKQMPTLQEYARRLSSCY